MFRPIQQQQPYRKPFTAPSIINKSSIPFKESNTNNIAQMFIIILEGDVNKIQVAMAEMNMSLNIKNEGGQSPIHVVLENKSTGMKETQKYELIKFLINNGASVSAFDINNVTPLHLAAKYQYSTIIDLLLENNANPNVVDSLNMNPLHYAVQGNVETCKPKSRNVGALIPKNTKTMKNIGSSELKKLTVGIIDVFNTDHFKRYFTHIKNTFKQIGEIYPFDFEVKQNEFMQEIGVKLADSGMSDFEKSEFIKSKITELTNTFNKLVDNKLKKTMKPLSIGPQNVEGWGPITDNMESFVKILPKEDPDYVKKNIQINFDREVIQLLNKYTENMTSIENKISTILHGSNDIYTYIHYIIQINDNALINKGVGVSIADVPQADTFEINQQTLKDLILNKDANQFKYQEINTIDDVPANYAFFDEKKRGQIKLVRGTSSNRKEGGKNSIKFLLPLSNDTGHTGAIPKNFVDFKLTDAENAHIRANPHMYYPTTPNNTRILQTTGTMINQPYYYVSKFIFAANRIYNHIATINDNVNAITKQFEEQYYYEIYQTLIPNILLSCYNVFQNILFAESEKINIISNTQKIKDAFYQNFVNNESHPYSYLLEYCSEYATNIITKVNNVSGAMKELYDECVKIVEKMNDTIKIINKKAGIEYEKNFLGTPFTDDTITEYGNVFNRQLKELTMPPKNIDEYSKIFGVIGKSNTNDKIVKLFYESYAPYIDITHYAKYLILSSMASADPLGDYSQSNKGYLNNTIPHAQALVKKITNTPTKAGYIGTTIYDVNTNNETYPNIIPKNEKYGLDANGKIVTIDSPTNTLNKADNTHLGIFGVVKNALPLPTKINPVIMSIGNYLDEHLFNIKFLLIQNMIELFNKSDFNPTSIPINMLLNDANRTNLDNIRQNYFSKMNMDENKHSILFTTVGKIADELINLYIKKEIYSNINICVKKFIDHSYNEPLITNIIDNISFNVDTGFSLKLNELFDELNETYVNPTNYNYLMHTVNVMEDEEEQDKQFQIYNSNYLLTADIVEKQCYKINMDVITKLLNKLKDVNRKDYNGFTPISYAIKNLHYDSINELLNNHGVNIYINTVKNNNGFTPYKYAISNYKYHIGSFNDNNNNNNSNTDVKQFINKFTEPIYKQIKENIQANVDYKNNIIKYMDIIFPQVIVMLNNLLYFYTKSYIGNWSYENQKQLEKLFIDSGFISNIDGNLPLVKSLSKNIVPMSIKFQSLHVKLNSQEKELKNIDNKINKINNTIQSLQKESLDTNTPVNRKSNIDNTIKSLTAEKKSLNNSKIQKYSQKPVINLKEYFEYLKMSKRKNVLVLNEKYLGKTANPTQQYGIIFKQVSEIYNDVFNYTIENTNIKKKPVMSGYEDYFVYNELWKQSLNNNVEMNSIFNIHILSTLLQKQTINNLEKATAKHEISNANANLEILNELYKKVFIPTIENMFDLKQEYNIEENYMLFEVMEIIKHVVKHVLCSSLYYAIVKTMTKYLISVNPKTGYTDKQYNDYIQELVNKIIDPANPKLHNYILNEMPEILVKLKTNIYKDDFDPHKNIKTVDELFQNIKNILITNDVFPIADDSTLINNLDSYIFKYYKELFDLIIPRIKNVIDNYCRFIINESRYMQIMILLNNQVINKEINK